MSEHPEPRPRDDTDVLKDIARELGYLTFPDGLVVKEEREVSLKVRSGVVGLLTYDERASFLLTGRP